MGWWTFFVAHAWRSAMEVEDRYYSIAPNNCVITLYAGHVRSLWSSLGWWVAREAGGKLERLGCRLDHSDMAFREAAGPLAPGTRRARAGPVCSGRKPSGRGKEQERRQQQC